MSAVRINLIGEFQCLANDGQAFEITAAKDQGVIAILALSEVYTCSRSRIIDLLWSDRSKEQAGASLRQSLWSLKKTLGDSADEIMQVDRKRVGLDSDQIKSDIDEFRELIASTDVETLEKALSLCRGDLLEGLVIQDRQWQEWLIQEREALRTKLTEILCLLIEYYTIDTNINQLIDTGRRLIDLDPFHEEGYRALMWGYAKSNRRSLALKQFERCRELLQRELNTDPSSKTQDLFKQIKEGDNGVGQIDNHSQLQPDTLPNKAVPGRPELESSGKSSIVVLPFNNMSGDPEQKYFSDGIAEDITTELSRFGDIMVIARHSAFQYRDDAVDVRQIRAELDADYVLEGSVRRSGNRLRINAQLIAAEKAVHVWSERYDREIEDVFAIQDEITETVVSTVAGQIHKVSTQRAKSRSTGNLTAYDFLLRGLDYFKGGYPTREDYIKASEMFAQAVELDPAFARARAWLACASNIWEDGATKENVQKALDMVLTALALDENEPEAHRIAGSCYLGLGKTASAEHHLGEALRINPNNAHIVVWTARLYAYTNRGEEAISIVSRAMKLNPLHPGWYWQVMGIACYSAAKFEDAITALERNSDPSDVDCAYLAASHAAIGNIEAANAAVERLLAFRPTGSLRWYDLNEFFQVADTQKLFIERLYEAGVPERTG